MRFSPGLALAVAVVACRPAPAEPVDDTAMPEPPLEPEPAAQAAAEAAPDPTLADFNAVLGPNDEIAVCCDGGEELSGEGCRRIEGSDAMRACIQKAGALVMSCSDTVMVCHQGSCTCRSEPEDRASLCCAAVERLAKDRVKATGCTEFEGGDVKACVDDGRELMVCSSRTCRAGATEGTIDCECVYSAHVSKEK